MMNLCGKSIFRTETINVNHSLYLSAFTTVRRCFSSNLRFIWDDFSWKNKKDGKIRTWLCIPLQTRAMTNTMLFYSYEWLINERVRICFSKLFFMFWKKVLDLKESVYLLNSSNQSNTCELKNCTRTRLIGH